nr:hypothetical protein GCM10020092_001760 [Actinoplanes digitatis]
MDRGERDGLRRGNRQRLGRATGGAWRLALATSAAVGALLTVALIALPARSAVRVDTFSPQTIAGGYAVAGVLLGLVIAYWAIASRPVAANLIATAAWLWSLAAAAVVVSIAWHRPSATYLSSWQFAAPDSIDAMFGTIYWPSALLSLLAALIIGVIGALPAVLRGDLGVGAATSGAVGPLLVAASFFVLAPQLTGALGPLESAYLIAPYAVLAGLASSALTVAIGQGRANRRAARPAPVGPRALGAGSRRGFHTGTRRAHAPVVEPGGRDGRAGREPARGAGGTHAALAAGPAAAQQRGSRRCRRARRGDGPRQGTGRRTGTGPALAGERAGDGRRCPGDRPHEAGTGRVRQAGARRAVGSANTQRDQTGIAAWEGAGRPARPRGYREWRPQRRTGGTRGIGRPLDRQAAAHRAAGREDQSSSIG